MGPRAGLDGRKISSPPGFDPGPSSPLSVAIPMFGSVLRLMQDECEGMWNDTDGENRCSRTDTLLGTTCPPQTPYRLS